VKVKPLRAGGPTKAATIVRLNDVERDVQGNFKSGSFDVRYSDGDVERNVDPARLMVMESGGLGGGAESGIV
jgi:hypothetical protein